MPRYYFNVYDGKGIREHDGVDLRDFNQARVEALRCASGIINEEAHTMRLGDKWRLEV